MDVIRISCLLIFVRTTAAIIQHREGPLVITYQSDRRIYYTFHSTNVNLSCRADGSFPLVFLWELDGNVIQNHTVYNNVSNLTLKPLESWIEGIYTCIVGNKYGHVLSDDMEVTEYMIYPTTPFSLVEHNYPQVNMPFTLHCDHTNRDIQPEIHWLKRTTTASRQRRVQYGERITYDSDGSLHFLYIDTSDEGEYTCNISYPLINYYLLGHTTVLEPMDYESQASFPHHMWNSEEHPIVFQGQTLMLRCVYGGNPIPRIKWHKILNDGSSSSEITANVEDYGRNLILRNISLTEGGEYKCVTETSYTWFNVIVEITPRWIVQPRPIITVAATGNPYSFVCGAAAFPEPNIFWYINTDFATSHFDPNGNLELFHVNNTQIGDVMYSVLTMKAKISLSLKCTCENYHNSISAYTYLYITGNVTNLPSPESTVKTTYSPISVTTSRQTPSPIATSKATSPQTPVATASSRPTSAPTAAPVSPLTPLPTPAPSTSPSSTSTSKQHLDITPIPHEASETSESVVIAGAVGGGIALVIIVTVVIYCVKRRQSTDSVAKSDVSMGYGNKGYSDVEMNQGKSSKMAQRIDRSHKPRQEDKRETYTGLSLERGDRKRNVYDQLGGERITDNVNDKSEEAEYCYISDDDIIRAQRQSQTPTVKSPVSPTITPDGVPNSVEDNQTTRMGEEPQAYIKSLNTKPVPKPQAPSNPSYGKMGHFASGKYSAIGNPAYSSEIPQVTVSKQSTPQAYEEPIKTPLSIPVVHNEYVGTLPDDGYFKLESRHSHM